MDEQQMQFVDPEWQPYDRNKQSVMYIDQRERPPSFDVATEEYASEEIPYRERGKLVPRRRTKHNVWLVVIPALIAIVCLILVGALALPMSISSHSSASPASMQVQPVRQDKSGLGSQVLRWPALSRHKIRLN